MIILSVHYKQAVTYWERRDIFPQIIELNITYIVSYINTNTNCTLLCNRRLLCNVRQLRYIQCTLLFVQTKIL